MDDIPHDSKPNKELIRLFDTGFWCSDASLIWCLVSVCVCVWFGRISALFWQNKTAVAVLVFFFISQKRCQTNASNENRHLHLFLPCHLMLSGWILDIRFKLQFPFAAKRDFAVVQFSSVRLWCISKIRAGLLLSRFVVLNCWYCDSIWSATWCICCLSWLFGRMQLICQ